MIVEIIATSLEDALAAEQGGASRLEVCSELERDGLAPPLDLVRAIVRAVRIPVRVMVRERNAAALADEAELERLCLSARAFAEAGAEGIVYGNLRAGRVDTHALERVTAAAPGARFTFHRVIEGADDVFAAVEALKRFAQVDAILTNGGAGAWDERIPRLAALARAATPEITILAGGGLTLEIAAAVRSRAPIRAFHFGRPARDPATIDGAVSAVKVRGLVAAVIGA